MKLRIVLFGLAMLVVLFGRERIANAEPEKVNSVFLLTPAAPSPVGATVVVPVYVTTKNGDVNAFSGSVTFDPAVLSYTGSFVVQSNGTFVPADQQITSGKLGYLFGLPIPTAFQKGTSLAFNLYFRQLKSGLPIVGVGNQPVTGEATDSGPKNLDVDFAAVQVPLAEFFAGPFWSLGKQVTIGVVWSTYPVTVWRVDRDRSLTRVTQCISLPNNGKKCTDEPVGGGHPRVEYYLEWDVGYGLLRSPSVSVER